jgi:ABC-type cobalamin/Fe3+-siderophores transport system ATPase subunit
MPDEYKGMRWLKCDLHVHTPDDSQFWSDPPTKLSDPRRPKKNGCPDEADIQEKARQFLRRCYEIGLEVIAITDHNFSIRSDPRDWFAVHLVEQRKSVAKEFDRQPITILPGFEIDIGYHVLCLFSPAKKQRHFERCNKILTKLGMPEDSRFLNGNPEQLRHNSQRLSLKKLLEIVQDEHNGIVIAAHADQNKGFLSDTSNRNDYSNLALHCVEFTANPPAQKYQIILNGNDHSWNRKYSHPAWIMSSDGKSLQGGDDTGKIPANSLGYRYSWIKMSDPSIESLRQAFLDHESRITLPEDVSTDTHPAKRERHAVIESVSVKNTAFFADQEIHFSPNMNCVIGGRGSGKSTLLEYIRIALKKNKNKAIDKKTEERIERIRRTLNENSELKVCWKSADGVKDCIVWRHDNSSTIQGEEQPDPDTFFRNLPVHFYSQQQLSRLTEPKKDNGSERLLELLDGFAKNELKELSEQEHILKRRIHDTFDKLRKAENLAEDRKRLQQEKKDLTRQREARQEIQKDAARHQQLKLESHYLKQLLGTSGKQFSDVAELAERIAKSHQPFPTGDFPHAGWFQQFDDKVKTGKDTLAKNICEAVKQFERDVQTFQENDSDWPSIQTELEQADEQFRKACDDKGLAPDDVGHLQELNQLRENKQREIEKLDRDIHSLKEAAENPEEVMLKLHQLWKDQTVKREEAASRANELAVLNDSDQPFIEVTVQCQQDKKSFQEHWQHFRDATSVKGNTRLGKNWEDCGYGLFSLFVSKQGAESPWQLLHNLLPVEREAIELDCGRISHEELFNHIKAHPEEWEQLRCSRVQDSVDMRLYRTDGSPAGSIAEGSLSDGQRNTAALALLLAQEGGPLIIDQPEDELDSNFVFNELIPMLRKVKSRRQIIMATHNANLPVNGDAELVYALEARGSKGEVRTHGGLDQNAVTQAVLDIMEGTEEAFRRRREKYHF